MKLARNSFSIFITKVCILGVLLANDVIISRTLGPAGRGMVATVMVIPLFFLKLGTFSLSSASLYYIAKKKYNLQLVASNLFSVALTVGLLFVLSFLLWNKVLVNYLLLELATPSVLWVVIAISPLLLISNYVSVLFISQDKIKDFNIVEVTKPITIFILLLAGTLKYGVNGAIITICIGYAANTFIALLRFSKVGSLRPGLNIVLLKDLFCYGIRLHGAMVLSIFLKRFHILVLAYYVNKETVGLFSVALIISELLLFIPTAMTPLLLSSVSASSSDTGVVTAQVSKTIFYIMFIVGGVMVVSSIKIIPLLWGEAFQGSVVPLVLLVPGVVAFGSANILTTHLLGIGRPGLGTILTAIATTVNVVLCLILIPAWGLVGAALSNTIAMFVLYVLAMISFIKLSHIQPKELFIITRDDLNRYKNFVLSFKK